MSKDTMQSLDRTCVTKTTSPERGNQCEACESRSPLLNNSWRPCMGSRAFVKESLLKLKSCLEGLCGLEWYTYAALGILTAVLSVLMDFSVVKLIKAHQWLYMKLEGNTLLQFFCWTLYPACLCAVAASFSHNICPFSTGSGIPEVRTMLAGFDLPQYLSLTHMFTKTLGLICTLAAGSTVFLGKVGPFVHLSTMMAAYLSRLCTRLQGQKKEAVAGQMLVVSAAVGVASCFGAPISGVCFSVEVMCSHFTLSHYFPCFFSAACGALTFRLFAVWSGEQETLQTLFKPNFPAVVPFYPLEILLFAVLGLLCGAVSCCYLACHRYILRFTKTCPIFIRMLTAEKCLYSAAVAFLLACVTFPHSAGQYMASKYSMKQLLTSLLHGEPWASPSHNASVLEPDSVCVEWTSSSIPIHLSLLLFLLMKLWMMLVACTLPIPAGYFMPIFIYGAAVGRLFGEGLAYVTSHQKWGAVNPGGYALAGAAAVSGAATHTFSPALLALELTGQFSHAGPVFLATLLSSALARAGHRPSFYDALSISKRLPHLPSLKKACARLPSTPIGQLLRVPSVQLQKAAGCAEAQRAANTSSQTPIPVVDSHESQVLLGYVHRSELLRFLQLCQTQTVEKHLDEVCCVHKPSVLLSPDTTVQEAHRILSVTRKEALFVTDEGKLTGLLTWPELKKMLDDLAKDI